MRALFQKFWSRKLAAASLSAGLLAVCWVLCQWLSLSREYFGTLCTSIVALFTTYAGANVAHGTFVGKKDAKDDSKSE